MTKLYDFSVITILYHSTKYPSPSFSLGPYHRVLRSNFTIGELHGNYHHHHHEHYSKYLFNLFHAILNTRFTYEKNHGKLHNWYKKSLFTRMLYFIGEVSFHVVTENTQTYYSNCNLCLHSNLYSCRESSQEESFELFGDLLQSLEPLLMFVLTRFYKAHELFTSPCYFPTARPTNSSF